MKIGLLYEGDLDEKPLQIIIKRILLEIKPELQDINFVLKEAYGGIEGQIRIAAILFYDTHGCDLAVFITDTDGKDAKCKRIKVLVSRYCKRVNPSALYITGCPDPELEQWYLDEENAIKQVFSLPGSVRLPYGQIMPKERLNRIIDDNNNDITVTPREIYSTIAEILNLRKLYMSNASFKSFYNALKQII